MTNDEIIAYRDALAARLRSVVAGRGLDQGNLAARMKALGYSWHRQTVSAVFNASRRVTAEEILGLSIALETSISELMAPLTNSARSKFVSLPSGAVVAASEVSSSAGAGMPAGFIRWDGDEPILPATLMLDTIGNLPDTTDQVRQALARDAEKTIIHSNEEILELADGAIAPYVQSALQNAFDLLDEKGGLPGEFERPASESAAEREARKQAYVEASRRDVLRYADKYIKGNES